MRREVETWRFARDGVLQGRSTQVTEGLGRILAAALLPFLVVIGFLSFAGVASAQTAPDQVSAYVDSLGVHVGITACQVGHYDDQTQTSCYNFGIYRNPPGFDKPAIGTAYLINSSSITFTDPGSSNLQVGQSYSYRVCTNLYPDNTGSNCKTTSAVTIPPHTVEQPPAVTLTADATNIPKGAETNLSWTSANATSLDLEPFVGKVNPSGWTTVAPQQTTTYTLTASGPGGKTTANATINVFCPTPTVPEQVDAFGDPSGIELKWTNPNTPAGQSCPVPSNQVLIYRLGPGENQFQLVATLSKAANNGILPNHYTDKGPFQPHTGYLYEVCEVGPPNWQNPYDCNSPREAAVSWGADPVLTAKRLNGTTVQLRLNLDQNTVSSIVVTRQGSDDPCRQGQKLGNGLQGCSDNPLVLAQNTPIVYNWTASANTPVAPGFDQPLTPPFVINMPDDSAVKPGAEYWYQTAVVWLGNLEQDAAMVTVPSIYATAPQQNLVGGLKPLKSNSNAPAPPSGSTSAAAPAMIRPASPVIASSSPLMASPASTTASPAPSVMAARPAPTTMVRPASPTISASSPMMASAGSTTASPAPSGSATATNSGMRPMITPASRTTATSPMVVASRRTATLANAVNRGGAMNGGQQRTLDAPALYALGEAYCAKNLKNACLSYMYVALSSARNTGNAALATQIKTSLAAQGVTAK